MGIEKYRVVGIDPWTQNGGGIFAYYKEELSGGIKIEKKPDLFSIWCFIIKAKMLIIGAYIPPYGTKKVREWRIIIRTIVEEMKIFHNMGWRIIFMGDLNAKFFSGRKENEKTKHMAKLIKQYTTTSPFIPAKIKNLFGNPLGEKVTFFTKSRRSLIDWALINQSNRWCRYLPEITIYNRPLLNSDHFPILTEVRIKEEYFKEKNLVNPQISLTWDEELSVTSRQFAKESLNRIYEYIKRWQKEGREHPAKSEDVILHIYQLLIFGIYLTGGVGSSFRIIKNEEKKKKKGKLRKKIRQKIKEMEDTLQGISEKSQTNEKEWTTFKNQKEEIRWLFHKDALARIAGIARKAEELGNTTIDQRKFWAIVSERKRLSVDFADEKSQIQTNIFQQVKIVEKYFKELFSSSFTPKKKDQEIRCLLLANPTYNNWDEPFIKKELEEALKEKKSSAAPGLDMVPIRILKQIIRIDYRPFLLLMNKMLQTGQIPEQMVIEKANAIPKKINASKPSQVRLISVSNSISSTFYSLLAKRVQLAVEKNLDHSIGGARKNRGVGDQTRALFFLFFKTYLRKAPLIASATDISKMFDSINTKMAEVTLMHHLGNGALCKAIVKLLNRRTITIGWRGIFTEPFHGERGTPQGNPLSVYLPNIIFSPLLKKLKERGEIRLKIGKFIVVVLNYVDDTITLSLSIQKMKEMHNILELYIKRFGMKLNQKKHEVAVLCHESREGEDDGRDEENKEYCQKRNKLVEGARKVYENAIVQPKDFTYLGVTIDPRRLSTNRHFEKKVGSARSKGMSVRDIGMFSIAIAPEAHRAVYIGSIRPTMLFGAESLPFSWKTLKAMRETQNTCLAGALKIHTGTSFRLVNEIMGVPSIRIFTIKIQFQFISKRLFATESEKSAHRARAQLKEEWQILKSYQKDGSFRVEKSKFKVKTKKTNPKKWIMPFPLNQLLLAHLLKYSYEISPPRAKDIIEILNEAISQRNETTTQGKEDISRLKKKWKNLFLKLEKEEHLQQMTTIMEGKAPIRFFLRQERNKLWQKWEGKNSSKKSHT